MKGCIAVLLCFTSISMAVAQQAEQCGENQEPSNCRECIRTCANYKNPPVCSVVCESGCPRFCNCKKNYVYEYEGGKCIPIDQCPRACASKGAGASDQGASAPGLEDYMYDQGDRGDGAASSSSAAASGGDGGFGAASSSSSAASGGDSAASASSAAESGGDGGFGAASSSSSAASAPASQPRRRSNRFFGPSALREVSSRKPKNCNRPNEVFDNCGTSCEKTCSNKDDGNNACSQQCKPGCRCRKGFVRNEEGDCIYADNCFRCSSKPNEIWKPCGKNCEPSCEVPNPEICSQQCTPDCRCKEGYVRYLGICIGEYDCPSS